MRILVTALLALALQSSQTLHQVTLHWTAPAPNGAVISHINVYRSNSVRLTSPVLVCTTRPAVTTCVDTKVQPNQNYWYYSQSVGTEGTSARSNAAHIFVVP